MRLAAWLRASIAGLAGGAAWFAGLLLLFGPAQGVLTDPARQSAKMLAVFAPGEGQPKAYDAPHLVILGVLAIGMVWGWVYASIASGWGGAWWRRGLRLALELALWLGVLLLVGLAIAAVDALFQRRPGGPEATA